METSRDNEFQSHAGMPSTIPPSYSTYIPPPSKAHVMPPPIDTSFVAHPKSTPSSAMTPTSYPLSASPFYQGSRPHPSPSTSMPASSSTPVTKNTSSTTTADGQPRKRTRATPEQLAVLEKTFSVNPSPNNRVREQLSRELGMSERSIQIWFQNRRAKVKNMAKRSSLLHDETIRMQYYAASAAAAACQAASLHQQHTSPDGTPVANPDLYYYYYYYYYNQQQQQQQAYYAACDPSQVFAQKASHQATPPPPPPMPSTSPSSATAASKLPWSNQTPPASVSPSSSTQLPHPLPTSASTNRVSTPPVPTPVAVAVAAAAGRSRSHSVGHSPYHPYQRANGSVAAPAMRSSTSTTLDRHHRRNFSSSPAPPSSFHPPPPPPPPMSTMWPAGASMPPSLVDQTIMEEFSTDLTASSSMPLSTSSTPSGYYNVPMIPMAMSGFVPDDRLGTPMSMDDLGPSLDDIPSMSRISVEALQIGTWKRMSLRPHDLECFFDRQLRCMVWRIQDGQQRFKMHIGLDVIEKMQLDPLMERMGWARLSVTVTQPEGISFYMEDLHGQGSDNWTQCRDFTQDRQATSVTLHAVDGPAMALRTEWIHLVAQDPHLKSLVSINLPPLAAQQPPIGLPASSSANSDTALGPHGQSMLGLATSREVTPADLMMAFQDSESMLQLMEKDAKDQESQNLLLFQGV